MDLTEYIELEQTDKHLHLNLTKPCQIVSSAVLNGGVCEAKHVVNLQIPDMQWDKSETPAKTILNYCQQHGWQGHCVGMMTAASMQSFRMASDETENVKTAVLITSGLNNARRAGDKADQTELLSSMKQQGTINIIALTTARLNSAATIEAIQLITEAKSAVLQDYQVKSSVSDKIATGTGTDATVFINGHGPIQLDYCGKHVLFGEILARLVIEALSASLEFYRTQ